MFAYVKCGCSNLKSHAIRTRLIEYCSIGLGSGAPSNAASHAASQALGGGLASLSSDQDASERDLHQQAIGADISLTGSRSRSSPNGPALLRWPSGVSMQGW